MVTIACPQSDNTRALQEAQEEISRLQQEIEAVRRERVSNPVVPVSSGSAEAKRELLETKDRNTALQQQLIEYEGTIKDQTKVHNIIYILPGVRT